MEHSIISFIAEYWQFAFLYVFKYLKDISTTLKALEVDIAVLKKENEIRNAKPSKIYP